MYALLVVLSNTAIGEAAAAPLPGARSERFNAPKTSRYPAPTVNMSYSLVDHHPSCKAHELFAKGVYLRMQQAGYVTPPSAAHP